MKHGTRPPTRRRGDWPIALGLLALSLVLAGSAAAGPPRVPSPQEQLDFGVAMAKRGLWSEAHFRFNEALRQRPEDPRILNNLAVASEALGRFEAALDYYQRALKANPGSRELKRNYTRFLEFYQGFKPQEEGKAGETTPSPDAPAEGDAASSDDAPPA